MRRAKRRATLASRRMAGAKYTSCEHRAEREQARESSRSSSRSRSSSNSRKRRRRRERQGATEKERLAAHGRGGARGRMWMGGSGGADS
eukprot:1113366-Rhodomonas_salina.1